MDQPSSILIVDDEELNRELLGAMVEVLGHDAEFAGNGREALRKTSAGTDLVLLDIMMPEMDGIQVLEHLKADPERRHIPVVVLSALDDLDTIVRCITLGAEDYLGKPFNRTILKARIDACLEKKRFRDRELSYIREIERERQRSDDLLRVIVPDEIVKELKATGTARPRLYQDVAVLFCDIVGFTPYCGEREPEEVVASLQDLVEAYEDLTLSYGMQKIKTMGDAFMATAGLLRPVEDPVDSCVRCGLDMIAAARRLPVCFSVRVGVHAGPVIAGIVGRRQYQFDLWGDTVNTAARVESHGAPNCVNVSSELWPRISQRYRGESLGITQVKGKGDMELFRVMEPQPAPITGSLTGA